MKKLIAVSAFAVPCLTVGCGASAGANNVSSCKAYVKASTCGTTTAFPASTCDGYANTTCDISAYFDCAKSHYVCLDGGTYDSSKLSTFSADCAAKATCK